MRKAIATALLFFVMIPNVWAENFTIAPPGNWNKVQTLPLNTNVVVELRQGMEIDGEFVRLTEDAIVVREFEREKTYPKGAVVRVKWMRSGSRARNAAIVGGIFFGIGFGLGYAAAPGIADQDNLPAGERASAAAAIGGLIGGAAAAISLAHRPGPRAEVIYRAR